MNLLVSKSREQKHSFLRVVDDKHSVCGVLFIMAHKKGIPLKDILPGSSKSCEKMIGNKFGRLLVTKYIGCRKLECGHRQQIIEGVCDCGSVHLYVAATLKDGRTSSCGCFQLENSIKIHTKHGQKSTTYGKRGTILYARWRSMFDRVRSNPKYANVKIAERWQGENGFVNFCNDIGEMPTPKHTVDRYPNKRGNYEPGNVRWATMREQMQNIEKNINVMFDGKLLCLSEIARQSNIDPRRLNWFFRKRGMDIYDAVNHIKSKK